MFPFAAEGDPKRKRNEPHVGKEALFLDVQEIQPKFLSPGQVAWREYLCKSGQSRYHLVPGLVSRNSFDWNDLAVAMDFDLFGHQRPGPDEAHIAFEDVQELGKLVHCRRSDDTPDRGYSLIILRSLLKCRPPARVGRHGTKFPILETPTSFAYAIVSIKDRTAIFEFNAYRDQQP
jgi:hypothetical protein